MKVEGTDDIYDLTPAPGTVTEEGTFLNVKNLLKDTTAALLGGDATMVPDEALVALKGFIDAITPFGLGAAAIEFGSYAGTGSRTNARTFSFAPQIVIITRETGSLLPSSGWSSYNGIVLLRSQNGSTLYIDGVSETAVTFSGNTLTLTTDSSHSADLSYNASGDTYNYWALG